jgi:hypothetical protein
MFTSLRICKHCGKTYSIVCTLGQAMGSGGEYGPFCSSRCQAKADPETLDGWIARLALPALEGQAVEDPVLPGLVAGAAEVQGANGPGQPVDGPEASVLADWLVEQDDPRGTALRLFACPKLSSQVVGELTSRYLDWVVQHWLGPVPQPTWRCGCSGGWLTLGCKGPAGRGPRSPWQPLPPAWQRACQEGWVQSLACPGPFGPPEWPLPEPWHVEPLQKPLDFGQLQELTGFRWIAQKGGRPLSAPGWPTEDHWSFLSYPEVDSEDLKGLAGSLWLRGINLRHASPAELLPFQGLCVVDLSHCTEVNDQGLAHLARLPRLTHLCLNPRSPVTEEGIRSLQTARPGLVIEPTDGDDEDDWQD